jgi:hypothetical protein
MNCATGFLYQFYRQQQRKIVTSALQYQQVISYQTQKFLQTLIVAKDTTMSPSIKTTALLLDSRTLTYNVVPNITEL